MAETSGQPPAARGAAWRRRQRRLRSMLRHERQTVRMELAAALHHSWGEGSGRTKAYGHRRQPARVLPSSSNFSLMMAGPQGGAAGGLAGAAAAGQGQAAHRGRVRDRPESRGPCAADGGTAARCPPVLRFFPAGGCRAGYRSAEDLPGHDSAALRQPQMVEQLVHVPTVVSYSSLQQLSTEQIVDIPVPGGDGGGARGGLQGFPSGQNSAALHVEQTVDIPVPGRAGGGGVEVFMVFLDRVQQPLHLTLVLLIALGKGFFALFPVGKKVRGRVRTRGRN